MSRKFAAPLLVSTLLLAACGGGGNGDAPDQAQPAQTAPADGKTVINPSAAPTADASHPGIPTVPVDQMKWPVLTAGQKFGQDPTMKFDGHPPRDIAFKVLSEGDGPEIQSGQALVADFRGQVWQEENLEIPPFENTYETDPVVKVIGKGEVIPAWDLKLPGVKVGSRVMLVTPPSGAFGPGGNSAAGILGIDTLVFVIDILDAFNAGKVPDGAKVAPPKGMPTIQGDYNPQIQVPKSDPPKELAAETLIKGKGKAIKLGQTIAVNYRGVLWRDGKEFDSSWRQTSVSPLGFHLGSDQIIKGWNEGLKGKTVGSRVLLVVPPEMGYGSDGNAKAGIKGTDTLVFVVDILGAY